jgi:hypothetical protein
MRSPEALQHLLNGRRLTRTAWPRGTWVVRRTGYPDGINVNGNTADSFGIPAGALVRFRPYYQRWDPDRAYPGDGSVGEWHMSADDIEAADWNLAEAADPDTPLGEATVTYEDQDGHTATLTGDARLRRPAPGPAQAPHNPGEEMTYAQALQFFNAGHRIRRRSWPADEFMTPPVNPDRPLTADDPMGIDLNRARNDKLADDWMIYRDPPRS